MTIKINEGDIFVVPIRDNRFVFGKVLTNSWGFYDLISKTPSIDLNSLTDVGIAFKIWVSNFPIKKGAWKVIGNLPLSKGESEISYFYKQDKINNKLWKTVTGAEEIPVSIEECENLELAAVYDPEHVIERLEYYFSQENDPNIEYDKKVLREKGVSTI